MEIDKPGDGRVGRGDCNGLVAVDRPAGAKVGLARYGAIGNVAFVPLAVCVPEIDGFSEGFAIRSMIMGGVFVFM